MVRRSLSFIGCMPEVRSDSVDSSLCMCINPLSSPGFFMGNINLADYKMRIRAVQMNVAVAMIGYRLAPENPHPIPLTDCVAGLKWVR